MTDDQNVKNVKDTQKQTPAEKAETQPDLNPKDSAGVVELNKYLEKLADTSKIPNQLNCYKTIMLNQGKPGMWGLRVHFPGVFKASQIQMDALRNHGQGVDFKTIMQECISAGVIVAPRITDVQKFANEHESFGEAVTQILNFLGDGVSGKLR